LQPPGGHLQPKDKSPGRHILTWMALALVVALGLGVLLVLPKLVSGTMDGGADRLSPQVAAGPRPADIGDSTVSRNEAQQALQEFLRVRARLELANVTVWGEPEWSRAVDGADRGNDLFTQRQFLPATDAFKRSTGLLLSLESERDLRLAAALGSGWQALDNDDSDAATGFFEIARAIDPGSQDALDGLERSRVRPDLLRLMADGDFARSADDLPKAQAKYLEAVEMDGAYAPALTAFQDVTGVIDEHAFKGAMSRALSALEAGQINTAETALGQAARLRPDAEVVRNTRQELEQLKRSTWLEQQRRAAGLAESKEDWTVAVEIYGKVLAREPQAAFARQGLVFAQDRERLHQQLDHYLADPTRVYSDQPRANAGRLLESAASPPAGEVRLAEKIQRLEFLIKEATTPRTVTLQSDGMTSVQIYHVGRLGQFDTRQLELRPGSYTVVGSRPGYRDVRETLLVRPGTEQAVLEIRCEEEI